MERSFPRIPDICPGLLPLGLQLVKPLVQSVPQRHQDDHDYADPHGHSTSYGHVGAKRWGN